MRVLFLVSGIDEVSCRFRVLQYLPYLRARGIDAEVADLQTTLPQRWRLLRSVPAYDVVCVHRVFLSPLEIRWLRVAGGYVYDFDDAIMVRDSSHRRFASWQRRLRFRRMVSGAMRVNAGNDYLAAQARPYAARVAIIPTVVDLTAYPVQRHPTSEPIVGWIGTKINLMYLRDIAPALTRLAERRRFTLKVVSDGCIELPGVSVVCQPWSLAREVSDLSSFQIGIMPLRDDPWTRGKCAVKILQYFAAAVPVVCSPVGTNREVVTHGHTGYFAASIDEWEARLDELLSQPERRRLLGSAGRTVVERQYSVAVGAEALLNTLTGIPHLTPGTAA